MQSISRTRQQKVDAPPVRASGIQVVTEGSVIPLNIETYSV